MSGQPFSNWLRQLSYEELNGPDLHLALPSPTMIIPSVIQLRGVISSGAATVIHASTIPQDDFVVLMPLHEWSFQWLRLMATQDTIPHLSAQILCVTEYAEARVQPTNVAIADFMTNMMTFGFPVTMMHY